MSDNPFPYRDKDGMSDARADPWLIFFIGLVCGLFGSYALSILWRVCRALLPRVIK